jgi:16S rRNA (cytidine1402-2'-O)-methyltransferase
MLYVIATPIGNRGDISSRAIELLRSVDLIFCEDTRHSGPFLRELGVQTRLISLHQHNEAQRASEVIEAMQNGMQVALISDAGMPGICDPGSWVIHSVRQAGLPLTVVPGPAAFVTAWVHLGWNPPFQFLGFLPTSTSERTEALTRLAAYPGASIFYEAPHRMKKTAADLAHVVPKRRIGLARELTKKFEEVVEVDATELNDYFNSRDPRGEYVVLVGAPSPDEQNLLTMALNDQVNLIQSIFEIEKMQAIKIVANINKIPKRGIYKELSLGD